ncbi:MAG: hypothetical protein JO126_07615 [Alphaproteobacteria bacterium]|nr:hypothetical protein [Alphaproteobacteria bacterium]MBV8549306.1 hypothetical protein [Alphaproteobacteria bacterium]
MAFDNPGDGGRGGGGSEPVVAVLRDLSLVKFLANSHMAPVRLVFRVGGAIIGTGHGLLVSMHLLPKNQDPNHPNP